MAQPVKQRKTTTRQAADLDGHEQVDYSVNWVGEIAEVNESGEVKVIFPGNLLIPVPARSAVLLAPEIPGNGSEWLGVEVLLTFEGADPSRPIILGVIRKSITEVSPSLELDLNVDSKPNYTLNGTRIQLNADKELVLKCGKSTLVLRENGKLLIRGVNVVSRASSSNRIKGGSINLN